MIFQVDTISIAVQLSVLYLFWSTENMLMTNRIGYWYVTVLSCSSRLKDFSSGHLSVVQECKRDPENENMFLLFTVFSKHQSGKHVLYLNLPALVKF